jgi:predicted TIM-barrel fold metal-dependent hydrolase
MKIIDAHIHTAFQKKDLQIIAKENKIDFSIRGLKNEIKKNKLTYVISLTDTVNDVTPIGKNWIFKQTEENKKIIAVCGINPLKSGKQSIDAARKLLKKGLIKGFKIYSGYYPKYPFDSCYKKFYALAQEFDVPVIFHTGDTFSKNRLVKYAHPIHIDEVAVKWPRLKIIIAHAGYPWVVDAAEVAYKNSNVYLDCSGWVIGNKIGKNQVKQLLYILEYTGADKLLYGSDWPIVNIDSYLKFVKSTVPKKYWNKVFYKNAAKLFKII